MKKNEGMTSRNMRLECSNEKISVITHYGVVDCSSNLLGGT